MMASPPDAATRPQSLATEEYARRFGALLRRHRRRRSLSARRLSARCARVFTPADLRAHERGERSLDPETAQRLCGVYGIPVESVSPAHRGVVIDLERRELRFGPETFALPATDRPDAHLSAYVRVVNRLRAQPMRSPATVRRDDTEALAEALDLDTEEVVALLASAIGEEAGARRRVLALRAGTGTLAAVIVIGAASAALPSRGSESETVVLSAGSDPSTDAGAGADAAAAEDPQAVALPPTATVDGPNLHPLPTAPTLASAGGADAGPPFEDETNIDAPGGPVTIERDATEADGDEGESGDGEGPAARGHEPEEADEDGATGDAEQASSEEPVDETMLAEPPVVEATPEDYPDEPADDD